MAQGPYLARRVKAVSSPPETVTRVIGQRLPGVMLRAWLGRGLPQLLTLTLLLKSGLSPALGKWVLVDTEPDVGGWGVGPPWAMEPNEPHARCLGSVLSPKGQCLLLQASLCPRLRSSGWWGGPLSHPGPRGWVGGREAERERDPGKAPFASCPARRALEEGPWPPGLEAGWYL